VEVAKDIVKYEGVSALFHGLVPMLALKFASVVLNSVVHRAGRSLLDGIEESWTKIKQSRPLGTDFSITEVLSVYAEIASKSANLQLLGAAALTAVPFLFEVTFGAVLTGLSTMARISGMFST
jgi:hypothetical protein